MDRAKEFQVTLPSNVSDHLYPKNKPTEYTTALSTPIDLKGSWEVALIDVLFPHNYFNIRTGDGACLVITTPKASRKCQARRLKDSKLQMTEEELNLIYKYAIELSYRGDEEVTRVRPAPAVMKTSLAFIPFEIPAGYYESGREICQVFIDTIRLAFRQWLDKENARGLPTDYIKPWNNVKDTEFGFVYRPESGTVRFLTPMRRDCSIFIIRNCTHSTTTFTPPAPLVRPAFLPAAENIFELPANINDEANDQDVPIPPIDTSALLGAQLTEANTYKEALAARLVTYTLESTVCTRTLLEQILTLKDLKRIYGYYHAYDIFTEPVKFKTDIKTMNKNNYMFIYSDISAHQLVGDTSVPLLGVAPIQGEHGNMLSYSFGYPQYLPVSKNYMNTIGIIIRNERGEPIEFQSGSVICRLHFRRAGSLE